MAAGVAAAQWTPTITLTLTLTLILTLSLILTLTLTLTLTLARHVRALRTGVHGLARREL